MYVLQDRLDACAKTGNLERHRDTFGHPQSNRHAWSAARFGNEGDVTIEERAEGWIRNRDKPNPLRASSEPGLRAGLDAIAKPPWHLGDIGWPASGERVAVRELKRAR